MTSDSPRPAPPLKLRTPRSAAAAGIIFACLLGLSMALIQFEVPESDRYNPSWLSDGSGYVPLAVTLVPFAAIAFLWFMGVIRDHFGSAEDRFFATVFLGSGILLIASMFVWIGVLGATVAAADVSPTWLDSDSYLFVTAFSDIMGSTIMVRMAGVFVMSTSTIWLRTGVMPRWVGIVSIAIAASMLLGAGGIRMLRFLFPLWVLAVSILILIAASKSSDVDATPS